MIEVCGASYAYAGGDPALDGVSLALEPGERVVLLGRNGSGKSTLARLLNGSLLPSSGTVRVDGATEGLARIVGYVRQDPRNQIVSALVEDEVAFGPRNLGLAREEVLARVGEALAACGIADLRGRLTSELSGGEQQLLALAGVLAMRPAYLVLDEVGSQLDEASRRRVAKVVRRAEEQGVGVLEIAHGAEALLGASRVVVLAGGRVAWEGVPDDLLASASALEASGLADDPLAGIMARARARGWGVVDGPDALACDGSHETQPCKPCARHALSANGVGVLYGSRRALDALSLDARGLLLVLGPSGSGKSTLARALAGVLDPDEGRCELDGVPVRAGDVGLAFQRPEDQLFCDTVADELAYGPRAEGLAGPEVEGAAAWAASELGIERLLSRSPFELSGGQMRRVALAAALSSRPAAYVFDEPTAGLDAPSRRELRELVASLVRDGASAVVVTHDAAEWLDVASEVAFLAQGRLVARASAAEAARSPELFRSAGLEPPLLVSLRAASERGQEDA